MKKERIADLENRMARLEELVEFLIEDELEDEDEDEDLFESEDE